MCGICGIYHPAGPVDRMSMAAWLDARVPFRDDRVVELAACIAPILKLRSGTSKAILGEAFANLLSPQIAAQPKHAFDVPIGPWLRKNLRPLVEGLARAHLAGRDHAAQLSALLTWSL